MKNQKKKRKYAKRKRFLDFYNTSMTFRSRGDSFEMPYAGLCTFVNRDIRSIGIFNRMMPTSEDYRKLEEEGLDTNYWASGDSDALEYKFTELRQNIILFCAAMNGEL